MLFMLAGSIVQHSFKLKNTGNVALRGFQVQVAGIDPVTCIPALGASLAVGDTLTCGGPHLIDQDEVEAGNSSLVVVIAASNVVAADGSTLSLAADLAVVQLQTVPSFTLLFKEGSCVKPTKAGAYGIKL